MNGLDKVGSVLSIGCAVHCILTPIIIPLLPMLGFFIGHDGYFHLILSALIVGIAALALIPGYLKHHNLAPIISASIGIVLIVSMGIFEHFTESILVIVPTIVGSSLIVLGHYLNHLSKCECEHHQCH